MLGIGYFKGEITEYIIFYKGGNLVREGRGIAFLFLEPNAQIVVVPTSSKDANFAFNETTNNFQSVTIQGQFTYRIHNPKQAASLLNFVMHAGLRRYTSNDPEKLAQRISNVIQMQTRNEVQRRSLEDTLKDSEQIAEAVLKNVRETKLLEEMGVELLSVYFLAVKPTPEVARALEADYREQLLRKADEAVYARRAAAVEEERKIKEKELNTDITLEEQRQNLINLQGDNAQKEAEYKGMAMEVGAQHRAKAREMTLAPLRTMDPRLMLALGIQNLGRNAKKIGNLTITPEVLSSILNLDSLRKDS